MTHLRSKNDPNGYHMFVCVRCGAVAGQHDNEEIARINANTAVRRAGWIVIHPGWRFVCPDCQEVA